LISVIDGKEKELRDGGHTSSGETREKEGGSQRSGNCAWMFATYNVESNGGGNGNSLHVE